MLCPHCGTYLSDSELVCPGCGATVDHTHKEEGLQSLRQGRSGQTVPEPVQETGRRRRGSSHAWEETAPQPIDELRVYGANGLEEIDGQPVNTSYARYSRRYEPVNEPRDTRQKQEASARETRKEKRQHAKKAHTHQVREHMVNWARVAVLAVVLLIGVAVGIFLYLRNTPGGQRIMARMGQEATSEALWEVGEENLDTGNVDEAIVCFEKAREQDGDDEVNVEGLLLLGNAYEAAGQVQNAMDLYEDMYTNIVPSRSEPYRNMIRLLQAQDRDPEAAELMLTAYKMTGLSTFNEQRNELLPNPPSVDLVAGYYEEKKSITLSSSQDYDVYYTFDENAVLPEEGTLFTEPIELDEGVHALRAVAVNEDLVSDELTGSYKIIMPSPGTPRCNLAPKTYKTRQRVKLKKAKDNEGDTDITIYYTIDGSNPDADSPVYGGENIVLPSGRVTLKAIAVNGYGKSSNQLEVLYKIEAKPYPLSAYSTDDAIAKLSLYYTTRSSFQETYGVSDQVEKVNVDGFDAECEKHTYSWGYAVFGTKRQEWYLIELYFTSPTFNGPRGTALGDTQTDIVSAFRDMGQVASPSGNRGLYADDEDIGKIYNLGDGTYLIRYQCETNDSNLWRLEYSISSSGLCNAIRWVLVL